MRLIALLSLFIIFSIVSSAQSNHEISENKKPLNSLVKVKINWLEDYKVENSLINRINPPDKYTRGYRTDDSFQYWLRRIPLKEGKPNVKLYNGEDKWNQSAHYAVVDLDVGKKNLQQCADAVIRLRGEFLFQANNFDDLHFNYTSGDKIDFVRWSKGNYPKVSGNKVSWIPSSKCNGTYLSFRKYMTNIFNYAGTLSLSKELLSIEFDSISPGDVFIQGGSPGHAVLVMDVAVNNEGNKMFLIAQSYMPAQEMHILINPSNESISPWYSSEEIEDFLETPEWTFQKSDLKRFSQ